MVHFSGFYAWLKEPLSQRAQEDMRQTDMIQQAWTDSGKDYGYRKLHDDLRDAGETCSESRVARLASLAGITAQIGYKRRPFARQCMFTCMRGGQVRWQACHCCREQIGSSVRGRHAGSGLGDRHYLYQNT